MPSFWTTLGTGARTNYPWRHGNDILDYVIVGSGDLNTDHSNLSAAITATNAAARGATIWIEGGVRYRRDTTYTLRNGQSLRGRGTGAILRCDTTHSAGLQFMWNDDVAAGEAYATATDISTPNEYSAYITSPTYTATKGDWIMVWSWDQIAGVSTHYGAGFGQYPLELHQVTYWDDGNTRVYVPAFVRDKISIAPAMQVIPAASMSKHVTLGFEQLAKLTDTPSKSLHRMLSPKGNPSMDNLAAIFGALRKRLKAASRLSRSMYGKWRSATVALSEFELARVQRAMDALMKQRRPPPHVRPKLDLGFRVAGQSVEIYEIRPAWRGPADVKHESALAKATFVRTQGVWRVFWQRRALKWHGYEHRPEVNSIDEFASLVAEDAHACFFG